MIGRNRVCLLFLFFINLVVSSSVYAEEKPFAEMLYYLKLSNNVLNVAKEGVLNGAIDHIVYDKILVEKLSDIYLDAAMDVDDNKIQDLIVNYAATLEANVNSGLDVAEKLEKIRNTATTSMNIFSVGADVYQIYETLPKLWNGEGSWVENTAGLSSNLLSIATTSTSLASKIPKSAWAKSWAKTGFAEAVKNGKLLKKANAFTLYGQLYSAAYGYMRDKQIEEIKSNMIKSYQFTLERREFQVARLIKLYWESVEKRTDIGRGSIGDVLDDYIVLHDNISDSDMVLSQEFIDLSVNQFYLENNYGVANFDELTSTQRIYLALDALAILAVTEDQNFVRDLQASVDNGFNWSDIFLGAFQGSSGYKIFNLEDLKKKTIPCYGANPSNCEAFAHYRKTLKLEFAGSVAVKSMNLAYEAGKIIRNLENELESEGLVDVTNQVSVSKSKGIFNRQNRSIDSIVKVTNNSPATLDSTQFRLVLKSSNIPLVSLPDGHMPSGEPFWYLSGMADDDHDSIQLQFKLQRGNLDYEVELFSSVMPAILRFPVEGKGWSFTAGSSFHSVEGGVEKADDRHAMDLNLAKNKDKGKDVFPVFDGTVVYSNDAWGFVLIKHDNPLTLQDGSVLNSWYSGYMHMADITETVDVTSQTVIGTVSDQVARGDIPDHLHFTIYRGEIDNTSADPFHNLESIDIPHLLPDFISSIDTWVDWCGENPIFKAKVWWNLGEYPCDGDALSSAEKVQQMYIAYYGRPGDSVSVNSWADQLDATNGDMAAIVESFGNSPQYLDRFGNLTSTELVIALHQQMFNRDPGSNSLAHWVGEIDAGRLSVASAARQILNAASGSDKATIDNKVKVAQFFTDRAANSQITYDLDDSMALLASVTDNPDTVQNALDSINFLFDSVPANLVATAKDGAVALQWDTVEGASAYRVYFSTLAGTASEGQPVADSQSASFTHSGLTNSTTYYYVVRAVDSSGQESAPGNEVAATPQVATDLSFGLVAYYDFENNIIDQTINDNDGIKSDSVSYVAGKHGKAVLFGGVNNPGYIKIRNSSDLQFTEGATYSGWISINKMIHMDGWGRTKMTAGGGTFFAKSHDRAGAALMYHVNTEGVGGSYLKSFDPWVRGGWSNINGSFESGLDDWVYLTVTLSATEGSKIYYNGNLWRSSSTPANFSRMNAEHLYLGRFSDYWYPLAGMIDDFSIYNRALDQQEVMDLYGRGGLPPLFYTPSFIP